MKECCTEDVLALYVESDLPEAQMERIRQHLVRCHECRAVATELYETQSAFKSIRQDIAPASAYTLVREQVMNEVMRRTRVAWTLRLDRMVCGIRWRYAICGVAMMMIVGAMLWEFRSAEEVRQVRHTASVNTTTDVPASVLPERAAIVNATPIREPVKPARKRRKPVEHAPQPVLVAQTESDAVHEAKEEPARPVMVKLMTDDPSVVIYWIVDQKGGSE